MSPVTPVCPKHQKTMKFPASNIDQSTKVTLPGKEIENKFYYCADEKCMWRYSSELGDYFGADELPATHEKNGPPLSSRK
jgi:hypothetical protein